MSEENGIRLNKAIASAGVCSRRKADELIRSGVVAVNGHVVREMGVSVRPGLDAVSVRGKAIDFGGEPEDLLYFMLHKPIQVVSTASDPEGRPTVLDFLPPDARAKRLYPVGRLDYFSEGLILLTNDGELANRLTHPRHHLPKIYEARLRERPDEKALVEMRRGMTLAEGERLAPVEAECEADGRCLRLTLHQGVNRQIRRMCHDLGLTILSLRRIAIGPLQLGDLPKGKCRPLRQNEVAALKKAAGL